MLNKTETAPVNLLDLRPLRNLQWETKENDLVVLLVPKFRNRFVVKWFGSRLAKPNFHVKLDAFGSYVWNQCDGKTTVMEIGEQMAKRFGEPLDSLYKRLGIFIQRLARDRFLALESVGEG